MKRTLIASTIAAAFALAATTAFAQAQAPATAPAAPTQPERVYGYQLMTPEERTAYQEQMRAAATPEARRKIRDEHRSLMEQRAKEKGVTLAEPRGPRYGAGPGSGPHGGPGAGPRGDGPYSQLFTPEERDAFRDKMHAAQTPEEREKLRNEYRAQAETRAKEKGITLPPPGPRAGGPGPHGDHRGPGAGPGGRGGMYSDLLTPEERKAFHDQMQAATTPEERAKVRESHHAALQARAKEKGVTLPEWGAPRGPGAGPGQGPRGPGAGPGPQSRGPGARLLSADERTAYREKMRSAATAEEREKLREDHRALITARAKEQGITLPEGGRGLRGHGRWPSPATPQPNVPQQPTSA
jgi:Spy/CpxP family protein refolding chaperone